MTSNRPDFPHSFGRSEEKLDGFFSRDKNLSFGFSQNLGNKRFYPFRFYHYHCRRLFSLSSFRNWNFYKKTQKFVKYFNFFC